MICEASNYNLDRITEIVSGYDMFDFAGNMMNVNKNCLEYCYVLIDKHKIKGIIGIDKNGYLCLCAAKQYDKLKNIESKLLKYVLRKRHILNINILSSDTAKVDFYHQHGFKIIQEKNIVKSPDVLLLMSWALGCPKNRLSRRKGDS